MVFTLDLDDENAKTAHVNDLYRATAAVVLIGTICWYTDKHVPVYTSTSFRIYIDIMKMFSYIALFSHSLQTVFPLHILPLFILNTHVLPPFLLSPPS